ncbi:glycoside hydrolase family 30 protein [Konateibacter massiliensis]|uniref:glycoside hydrolase family 30 protein n=1 Tax=Konateibacter massiliensis TaxID=2002841 RepID=UPI000C1559AE|nr:glycoside hydrolase family 30 beta sandwich domain-containing protein [Konateibacter massiliensis]
MDLKLTTTTFANNVKEETKKQFHFNQEDEEENYVINLYPEVVYQKIEGFGGAITDAAGYVYAQMSKEQQEEALRTYFGKEEMNYQIVRTHMDSCDFSLGHYEAMSDSQDLEMESFNMERTEKYIFPLLEDAQKACETKIEIMLTPWSPPVFMKTNGERNHGGKLKEEYKAFWAEYICRYIKEFRNRGYQVTRISLQNEPKATQTWDSCVYTAKEEKIFLRDYMYPALCKNGLSDIEIFIWDHNKERVFDRACEIIGEDTNHMVAGIAFHWYSGDHFEALQLVKDKFPDKKLILSEACIEYCKYSSDNYLENAQKYAHDIIGNLNHGMTAFYDWNIFLDEMGGPNHVKNYCDAPYMFDMKTKKVLERNTLSYIRHFSHFIKPEAVRIAHTRYTEKLDVTAFKNTDGTIAVVLLNTEDEERQAYIRIEGHGVKVTIAPNSIATGIISR